MLLLRLNHLTDFDEAWYKKQFMDRLFRHDENIHIGNAAGLS